MNQAHWLERVEEIPEWVEARAMLLQPAAELQETAGGGGFVAVDRELRLGCGWGEVAADGWRWLVEHVPADGSILSYQHNADSAREALADWRPEVAIIHELAADDVAPDPDFDVRWATPAEIGAAKIDDPLMRADMELALRRGQIAVAFADGRAVSFCTAAVATENLDDIGIDTLPAYRRKGYATAVARWFVSQSDRPRPQAGVGSG